MKAYRLRAFALRHLYPLKRDFDLMTDMIYWPLMDTVLWGVTGKWLVESSGVGEIIVSILTALVLWNIIWRSQSEISRNLIDEIWNNNLVNLFSTPLSLPEWTTGVLLLSVFKTSITLAILVPVILMLYAVNVLSIGSWLVIFFLGNAITGWWLGFISAGIVLRYGPKFQTVIWTLPAFILPFSAVFYPLDKLPSVVQHVSLLIPATYIFESMRSYLLEGTVDMNAMLISFALNSVYLILSLIYFIRSFQKSRELGLGRFT